MARKSKIDAGATQPEGEGTSAPSSALTALLPKQRVFVEAYFACGMNGTEAARRAKYKQPRVSAQDLLRHPGVRAAIEERLAEAAMSANEVLARMTQIARGDMSDFLRVDEEQVTLTWSVYEQAPAADGRPDVAAALADLLLSGKVKPTDLVLATATVKRAVARLDLEAAGEAGLLGLIKRYQIDKEGKVSIELYDALDAQKTLAKHHGLLVEKHELRTPDGPIAKVYAGFDPDAV
jgi:hypothetical protein